jgi:hypothetical protein
LGHHSRSQQLGHVIGGTIDADFGHHGFDIVARV